MKPQRIFLIRHGESASNADRSIHSHTPDHLIPLTENGINQAKTTGIKLYSILNNEKIQAYISPYKRTRQTYNQIKAQFPFPYLINTYEDPRLREQEFGNYRSEEDYIGYRDERDEFGTFFYRIPHGESGADVYDRISGFLDTLHRDFEKPDYPPNVIIVTHGLTIRLFLMRWFHWDIETFQRLRNPHNCDIFEMRLDNRNKYYLINGLKKYPEVTISYNNEDYLLHGVNYWSIIDYINKLNYATGIVVNTIDINNVPINTPIEIIPDDDFVAFLKLYCDLSLKSQEKYHIKFLQETA